MAIGKLDQTKYNNMVGNASARTVISSDIFKAFIADVKEKMDDNYSMAASITQQAIINGNFSVNQRAKSGTVVLPAGAYGHDRWKAGASGCTYTFTTSGNVTTITITAGSLIQVIEGIHLFTGTYTLSWTGTAQGKIGAGSYGTSGITGAVTGGTNLNIEFGVGTLSKAQFNIGSTALPFQPRSFTEELALCQRYLCPIAQNQSFPMIWNVSALAFDLIVPTPVTMRALPTLVSGAVSVQDAGTRATYGDYTASPLNRSANAIGVRATTTISRSITFAGTAFTSSGCFLDAEL